MIVMLYSHRNKPMYSVVLPLKAKPTNGEIWMIMTVHKWLSMQMRLAHLHGHGLMKIGHLKSHIKRDRKNTIKIMTSL